MVDSILAVIVLILAGWAIAKNYDAKVVLFIAALVLLYSGLLLGHNVLGAKASTGLSWVDPFKVIKDQFVRQYGNAGLIIGLYVAYRGKRYGHQGADQASFLCSQTDYPDPHGFLGRNLPSDYYP